MLTVSEQSDFDAVAVDMGYKDASIAKTRMRQVIRKKIKPSGSGAVEKASTKKRKGTATDSKNGPEESPAKKGRGSKPKGGKAADEADEEVKLEQRRPMRWRVRSKEPAP